MTKGTRKLAGVNAGDVNCQRGLVGRPALFGSILRFGKGLCPNQKCSSNKIVLAWLAYRMR
jgi:hypothetical protein